jgi:hypothetical protein
MREIEIFQPDLSLSHLNIFLSPRHEHAKKSGIPLAEPAGTQGCNQVCGCQSLRPGEGQDEGDQNFQTAKV